MIYDIKLSIFLKDSSMRRESLSVVDTSRQFSCELLFSKDLLANFKEGLAGASQQDASSMNGWA